MRRTGYLIHQHIRYEYPGQIHELRQRLMIVPPARHGGQRLVTHRLEVSAPLVTTETRTDQFGNQVTNLVVEHVERAIDFTAWIVVERDIELDPVAVLPAAYHDPCWRAPSRLTEPDEALREVARSLSEPGDTDLALVERVNQWVHERMTYAGGVTGVRTTAAEALALGKGVCQDYAHIMLALLRCQGAPARYVSGHYLGEGGTHAWVEALLPDPARSGAYIARPFDPTHGDQPGLKHITVAVGRDYSDVAPTSGAFRAPYGGRLAARKQAGVTSLEYYAPTG